LKKIAPKAIQKTAPHRAMPRRAVTTRSETFLLFYVCGNFCRAVPSRTA
jgi:hypothetical protein